MDSVAEPQYGNQCSESYKALVRAGICRWSCWQLCSAKSRCDLTQQFPRSNIHGAARREHLALVSGKWLATHADGSLGAAAACCRNPECLAPSSHEVVPDCSGQPTPA